MVDCVLQYPTRFKHAELIGKKGFSQAGMKVHLTKNVLFLS